MDYKDFIDYIRQGSEDDQRRRKQKQLQEEEARRQAPEKKGGSLLDDILGTFGNVAKAGGDLVGDIVDTATDIPQKLGATANAILHEDDYNKQLKDLQSEYRSGKINKAELSDAVSKLTEDVIGAKVKVTDNGIEQQSAGEEAVDFAKQTVGAGVNTASVVPAAKGVNFGLKAAEDGVGMALKSSLARNAKEGAVFGVADTANELFQGNGFDPLRAAGNVLLPTAMGAGGDAAGYAIGKGAQAAKNSIQEFQALPRSVREGGYVRVPGQPGSAEAMADELIPNFRQEADTTPPAMPSDPTPIQTVADAPNEPNPGVTFKSREQIMADNKVQRPFMQKVGEALFDANAPLKDFAKEVEARTGKVLDVADDPHKLAQLRNGMDEAGAARLSEVVNDFDFVRQNNLAEDVKMYGVAQQVVNDRADVYSIGTVDAERGKLQEMADRLGPEKFGQVQAATQRVIDFQDEQLQRLRDNGFISPEGYDTIKQFNPYYFTRFNIADYIQANQKLFASKNSNNIHKNIIQAVKGMGDDRDYVIEDPFEAIVRSAIKTENVIQQNKVFKATQALAKDLPDMVIPLRSEDDVLARMSLASDNKELRPIRNSLTRIIKTSNRDVRRLQSQIDQLEKQGYKLSLKNGGQRMSAGDFTVQGLGGDVPTSKAGQLVDNATDDSTDLMKQFTKATGPKKNSMRGDVIAEQAGTLAETNPSKLGAQDTQTFLNNLIENGSRADIDKLKRMVDRRDTKLQDLLDEIGYTKSQYDEIHGKIKENSAEIQAHGDLDVPAGYEAVTGWSNGIRERIAIPQYIADAYKGKNDAQVGAMEKIFNATSRPFKTAATVLSPAFLVKNSIRDTGQHWLTSSNISKADRLLVVPYAKRWAQGFMDSLTNSDFSKQITEAGGGAAGIFNDRGHTDDMVRNISKKLSGVEVKTPKNMFQQAAHIMGKYSGFNAYSGAMQKAGRALEYAPRLAEARAAIEKGASDPAAAIAARNALGDLQNGGTVSRLLNNYTPFFNSILQGNKRVYDSVKENPQRAIAMLSAGVVLPAVSGYVWNRTMYPDVLNNLSEYDRENNFIIILGDNQDESGKYTDIIKIPKNDAAKIFANNIEAGMSAFAGEDPQSFAELFMKTIGYATPLQVQRNGEPSLDAAVGSAPILSNPLIRVPTELASNHSFFTGNDIVPDSKQGLSAQQQVTEKTSPIDAAFAQIGISPYVTQNVRSGVSASLLNGKSPIDQVSGVVSGSNGNRAESEFYQLRDKAQMNKNSVSKYINDSIAAGDMAGAAAAAQTYNQYLVKLFQPYGKQYGQQMTPELIEQYDSLKLNLSQRSIKQRQKNLQKKASAE